MQEEVNKAIEQFSKGVPAIGTILALFASQMLIITGRHFTKKSGDVADEFLAVSKNLIERFDKEK